jgi:uncharacterized protein
MNKTDLILMALAASKGVTHTPVQVQKLLFLLDKKLSGALDGPHFKFEPYDYGPFDKSVYTSLEDLGRKGLVEVLSNEKLRWRKFRLTPEGQTQGETVLAGLTTPVKDYVIELSKFVTRCSFSDLVSAIYKEFPAMRANSVFRG